MFRSRLLFAFYLLIVGESFALHFDLGRFPVAKSTSNSWNRLLTQFSHDGNYEVVPLNIGTGTHYTWIYVGSPPQRASVIVDTGSHVMAFPCKGCSSCGTHTDAPYDMSMSSTAEYVSCNSHPQYQCQLCGADDKCIISQSYSEGSSWTGTLVEDIAYLGNATSSLEDHLQDEFGTRMRFGCQTSETGLFRTQKADGIMGMADFEIALVPHLYGEDKIQHKVFSLCFSRKGGSMVLGAPEYFKHTGPILQTPIYSVQSHWYSINVQDIKFGDVSIGAPVRHYRAGKRIIVDSGTTDTFLPKGIANVFESTFEEVVGVKYPTAYSGICDGITKDKLDSIPPLRIIVEGVDDGPDVTLEFPATQFFERANNGKYCSNIFLTEGTGGVLGANLMLNHDYIFDTENAILGFATADCDLKPASTNQSATSPSNTTATPTQNTSNTSSNETTASTSSNATTSNTTASSAIASPSNSTETSASATENSPTSNSTDTSAALHPSADSPTTDLPATLAPTTSPPATLAPATSPPTTSAPTSSAPTTSTPTTSAPVTSTPTTSTPTTSAPTTSAPTTSTPTTSAPTTSKPVTPSKPTKNNPNQTLSKEDRVDGDSVVESEEQPFILTIVGIVVCVLLIGGGVAMCGRRRKRTAWTRLEADVSNEDGLGLISIVDSPVSSDDSLLPPESPNEDSIFSSQMAIADDLEDLDNL